MDIIKKCEICGAISLKVSTVPWYKWRRYQTCGKEECSIKLRIKRSVITKKSKMPEISEEHWVKTCVICGKEFRKPESSQYRWRLWNTVRTCSRECTSKLISQKNKGKPVFKQPRLFTGPKICVVCNSEFWRGQKEKSSHFNRRTNCGDPSCRRQARIKQAKRAGLAYRYAWIAKLKRNNEKFHLYFGPKRCIICNKDFMPGKGEGGRPFKLRKCCSLACKKKLAEIIASERGFKSASTIRMKTKKQTKQRRDPSLKEIAERAFMIRQARILKEA